MALTLDQSTTVSGLAPRLREACTEPNSAMRIVRVVAVLTSALGHVGVVPVLVGGGAVEFYTSSRYETGDIDLLAPRTPDVLEVMRLLGFSQSGRNFVIEDLELFVEFPNSYLPEEESFVVMEVDGVDIRVVSLVDLVMDRLESFAQCGSLDDGLNILYFLSLSDDAIEFDCRQVCEKAEKRGLLTLWECLTTVPRGGNLKENDDVHRMLKKIADDHQNRL